MKNPVKFFFSKEAEEGYVPNRNLLCYAAGLAGQNMEYSFLNSWWYYFCTVLLKIDPVNVGYVQGVSRIWDAINDPLIGAIIDRRRCKSGEKLRPYLLKFPPFIGLVSLVLFINFGLSPAATLAIMVVAYLLWDMIYSVQDVALWGMIALSSPHSHERSRVAQWVSIGASAGSNAVMIFQLIDSQNFRDKTGISETVIIFCGALVFCLGGQLISMSAYKMHELVRTEQKQEKESIIKTITVLRHNRTLLLISLARFLGMIFGGIDHQFFYKSSVTLKIGSAVLDGETSQMIFSTATGIPSACCLFAALPIMDRIGGMKKSLITAEGVNIIARVIAFFIGFTSMPRVIAVGVLFSISSILISMKDIAHRSLTSDSIDYVEWKTGQRTEGISFSIQNLVSKFADAVKSIIKGYILKFIKYDSNFGLKEQGALFMKAQWPLFVLWPAIGSLLYIIVISFVNDDKDRKAFIEKELRARREQMGTSDTSEATV